MAKKRKGRNSRRSNQTKPVWERQEGGREVAKLTIDDGVVGRRVSREIAIETGTIGLAGKMVPQRDRSKWDKSDRRKSKKDLRKGTDD